MQSSSDWLTGDCQSRRQGVHATGRSWHRKRLPERSDAAFRAGGRDRTGGNRRALGRRRQKQTSGKGKPNCRIATRLGIMCLSQTSVEDFPMTKWACVLGVVVALVSPLTLPTLLNAGEPLQIGVAETDITPPQGFLMAGYYHERKATGTIDPLKAKAIVFRSGKQQAAIVVCDLIGIAVDLSTEARRRASTKTGIPVSHIVVSATHSHTAPDYTRDLYEHLATKPAPPISPGTQLNSSMASSRRSRRLRPRRNLFF